MATGSTALAEPAGHDVVTLAGTIKTNGQFTTQPVVGDQIIYPTSLSVSADLTISGPTGTYTLYHIIATTGATEAITYSISTSSTVTLGVPSGHSTVTLSGTILNDGYFPVQPVAGDQIIYPDALTVSAQLAVSGAAGTYTIWHVKQDGVTYYVQYLIGSGVGGGSASLGAGSEYTTATIQAGFDNYVFEGWSPQPVAGEQITTLTTDGYFNSNGDYITEKEHVHSAWYTALDGTTTHFNVDSVLAGGVVLTPRAFSFTNLTNQPTDTWVESNAITVLDITAGYDVPVSCAAGAEFAISSDGGNNYTAYSSTPDTAQLNDMIKMRLRTSTLNNTPISGTLTVSNVSASWTVTTNSGVVTSPTQFTFNEVNNAEVSTEYESDPVQILGLSAGVNAIITVTNGEYAKSTDGGVTYSPYTSAAGTVAVGDFVKAKGTSQATYDSPKNVNVTVATVSDAFIIRTRTLDATPDPITFPDKDNQPISTTVESIPRQITGIDAGVDVAISVSGGLYARSTDNGATYGAFTATAGVVNLNDWVKVQMDTSPSNGTSKTATLTLGSSNITFVTITAVLDSLTGSSGTVITPSARTVTLGTRLPANDKVWQPMDLFDRLDFAWDMSTWLGSDTISTVSVTEGFEIVDSVVYSSTAFQIWINPNKTGSGAIIGSADRVTARVVTANGREAEISSWYSFIDK